MNRIVITFLLALLVSSVYPNDNVDWSRTHDPMIGGFSKSDVIANEWNLLEFKNELKRSTKYEHNVWYYLGSKRNKHVFMCIDYASPSTLYDEESGDLYCDVGPFVMLASIPASELKFSKRMRLTEKSKKWIEVDSIEDLGRTIKMSSKKN